jgi:peptide deformylase
MIYPIRKMGDPCLLMRSSEITAEEFNSPALLQLIEDLQDTQKHLGGVGIAAPQIGINKRLVVIEYYQAEITRYSDVGDCPLKVIINPEILLLDGEQAIFNEGCLSVPGLRGEVSRPHLLHDKF